MKKNTLRAVRMDEDHPNYVTALKRKQPMYQRKNDLRSEFARDYTRVIFSQGYRRLKHKTQVFFATDDDHVCTRIEHVNLVESISYTIASYLGLNTELTKAIAVGHDLGHAPFGHGGETILTKIAKKHGLDSFWHERNSLHFVDDIETLEDNQDQQHNLNLTYAVRDGIICHCGEMNQQYIMPRNKEIDLNQYHSPGQYNPYTYEGCVVKIADKIAYLARDIEDALRLDVIDKKQVDQLKKHLNLIANDSFLAINNGSIVNYFIKDVVMNSSIEQGIGLSNEAFLVMKEIMKFNYNNIYLIKKVQVHNKYVELILSSIFEYLYDFKDNKDIIVSLKQQQEKKPLIIKYYLQWLYKYAKIPNHPRDAIYQNHIVYDFETDKQAFEKSILDYLASMTDSFIIKAFQELLSF